MINSAVYDNIVGRALLVMSHDKIIQHKADKKKTVISQRFCCPIVILRPINLYIEMTMAWRK